MFGVTVYNVLSSINLEPKFDQTVYTVPENNGTVLLCVDIGVVLSEKMELTITGQYTDPPDALGLSLLC